MMNLILQSDSYKISHWRQYPQGTQQVYSYLESRGNQWYTKTIFFGLQYYIRKFLLQPITGADIEEADDFAFEHFGSNQFNLDGWNNLLNRHGGYLPLRIMSVDEGLLVDNHNVLMTIENTDPEFFWLTNYLETLLMKVWYPITIATRSFYCRKIIENWRRKTSENINGVNFQLHDFGYRGVSSEETAAIGDAAHLTSFMGTDTIAGILLLRKYYDAKNMSGFSIPASEHSTITSWGESNECEAMRNMLIEYPNGLVACVSDSYNIERACKEYWGNRLKDLIISRDGKLIVRPDGGKPEEMVVQVLRWLGESFGTTVNSKGYKILHPKIGVIHGDGIEGPETIESVLSAMADDNWSAENVAFGSGGGLLQKVNRDTFKFAIKCSNVTVNGNDIPVRKNPKGYEWKASKAGRFALVDNPKGGYQTINVDKNYQGQNHLKLRFENGKAYNETNINEVRNLISSQLGES